MKNWLIICIVILVTVITCAVCNAQEPIYKVGGSNEKILPYNNVALPNLSSDGKKIVFLMYKGDFSEIWTINSDGNGAKVLLSESFTDFNSPVWSPDGLKFVFLKKSAFEMWMAEADGKVESPLTDKTSEKMSPVWWPDSTKIIFYKVDSIRSGLYILNFIEKSLKPFGDPEWGGPVSFSPDTKTLLILEGQELIFLNPDGTIKKKKTVGTSLTHGEEPIWSPDGRYIILGNLLYVLATDEEIPFLPDDVVRYKEAGKPDLIGPKSITLSKDGKKIAFVMEEPNAKTYRARIKIMDLVWQ